MSLSRVPLAALLLLSLPCFACVADPPAATKAEQKQPATADADPDAKADVKASATADAKPLGKYELTEEEVDLLARDPKTLGPEQNRKRAYALRKKIMQNPDSEAARALEDAREAALAGQVEIPGQPPKEKGMVIEAPEYLRNPDQTYDPSLADDKPAG
ncbi:hypothetical protein [Enhygromyxa salina]|uniref:Uncharacterized protein n=1 Tax=Enhygromyxa salina TaxID=215803 RepID=A0A2S9YLR0_9BACT|nr:hypothetical protein [Enhygromyxa salina]PRQ06044.1 hypothetical protein ENSA7_43060 [Enhygromyxa salina]